MTTKQILGVVLVVWCGCALWAVRSVRAHGRGPAGNSTDDPADDNGDTDDTVADADDDDVDSDDVDSDGQSMSALFSQLDEAYAVGERGAVYHSSDAGRVWVKQLTGVDEDLHAVWGAHGRIWAVGDGGRIVTLVADGVWRAQSSGVDADLHAVWGSSDDNLWAAGDDGVVLHSRDGGASWRLVESGTDEDLRAISGAPGGIYVTGENGLIKRLSASRAAVSTTAGAPAPRG